MPLSNRFFRERLTIQRSPLRKILMMGFHLLVTFLCVQGVKDTQCGEACTFRLSCSSQLGVGAAHTISPSFLGFKLFTRKAAMGLFVNQKLRRWSFDVELLFIVRDSYVLK